MRALGKRTADRRWLPLNALRAFEGVAKHGSFTAAASAQLTSQSALSRHVIALEDLLGVQLFERRPHSLKLTSAGQRLFPAVMDSLDRLQGALEEIVSESGRARQTLRVHMPESFAAQLAVPLVRDFRRLSGGVDIDLVSADDAESAPGDFDLAVTCREPHGADLVVDLLWRARLGILCHPRIAALHGGKSLSEFIAANELIHVRGRGPRRCSAWSELVHRASLDPLSCDRGPIFDTAMLAVQYALSGQGLALVDIDLFIEELRAGRLVRPFDALLDGGHAYFLVTHRERLHDRATSVFRSWLLERFGTRPTTDRPAVRLAVANE